MRRCCEQQGEVVTMRDDLRQARDDGAGRILTVRLDWRSLIPVVALVATVWLLGRIWETLLLLVVALILAGALAPLMGRLEARGLGRGGAVGVILLGLVAALGALGALVLPALVGQVQGFVAAEPQLQAQLAARAAAFPPLAGQAAAIRDAQPIALLAPLAAGVLGYAGAAAQVVVLTLTVVVMTLYLLADQERIRGFAFALLPRAYHVRVARILLDMGTIVGGYMRGQALTSLAMGVVVFAVLAATGTPNPLALAAFAALADLVPLVGGFLVLIPVTLAALAQGPVVAAIVFGVILAYQQLEGHILIPRIYGQTLRLSPLAVLVALIVGGQLLGIIGALLALPLAAGLRVLVEDLRIALPGELPGEASERDRDARAEEAYAAGAEGSSALEAAGLATTIAAEAQEETLAETGMLEHPLEERGDPPLTPPAYPNPAR
jgi:predicted PurR-regulated permease PerM